MRINIYGNIVPEAASELSAELQGLQPEDVLEVHINSNGGSVVAGLAIYDLIAALPNKKIAIIEGIAASAATYAPLACNVIRMHSNATFMVHRAEAGLYGTIEDIETDLAYFRELQTKILQVYSARTGVATDELYNAMSKPIYMTAQQALEAGYIDEIIGDGAVAPHATNEERETGILHTLQNLAAKIGGLIKKPAETPQPTEAENAARVEAEAAQNAIIEVKSAYEERIANMLQQHAVELEEAKRQTDAEYALRVANALSSMGIDANELPQSQEPENLKPQKLPTMARVRAAGLAALTGE